MPDIPPSARMINTTVTSGLAALSGRTATLITSRTWLPGTPRTCNVTPGRAAAGDTGVLSTPPVPPRGEGFLLPGSGAGPGPDPPPSPLDGGSGALRVTSSSLMTAARTSQVPGWN